MKLFLDTSDVRVVRRYLAEGICDGVTTNPTIIRREGNVWPDAAAEIATLLGDRPLSLEVTTDEVDLMVAEGVALAGMAPNIAVKVPVTNSLGESCLRVVHELASAGIDVNVTCCMTYLQLVLAAKAGARYVSLFGGRVDDEGGDVEHIIQDWCDLWLGETEIIAASVRTVKNVADWTRAGADIVTVSPSILERLLVHARTKETVTQFVEDARA